MIKKKLVQKMTYLKGTEITAINEIRELLKRANVIYAKDQTIYDDDTQSLTVEIHFKPKQVSSNIYEN